MFLKIAGGKVLTPSGTINANVIIKDGVIEEITGSPVEIPDAKVYDAKGMSVVPGGIDLHIHGGGGREFEEATEDAFRDVMASHARFGTTSFLATLPACPVETIWKAISTCEKLISEPGSPLLGLHLEGPYLNPHKVAWIAQKSSKGGISPRNFLAQKPLPNVSGSIRSWRLWPIPKRNIPKFSKPSNAAALMRPISTTL